MDPLQHLDLLLRYDRSFNLRHSVRSVVGAGARVLDAGCGLGLLSYWAIESGASRVVAVDMEGIDLARALAVENGYGGAIDFIQTDLSSVDLPEEPSSFDVILAMVYLNDPRRDDDACQLTFKLRDRYLVPGGTMLPDRVRYFAQACDWPTQDYRTRIHRWESQIAELQDRYGFRFGALQDSILSGTWSRMFPVEKNSGRFNLDGVKLMTTAQLVHEVDYSAEEEPFPTRFSVPIDSSGMINAILWRQDLWSQDRLLFSNDSISWITDPIMVKGGDAIELHLGEQWRKTNAVDVYDGKLGGSDQGFESKFRRAVRR